MNTQQKSMLIFDAAYLFMGSKYLEQSTQRKFWLNDNSLNTLLNYIQANATNGELIQLRHYVTSDNDQGKRKPMYNALKKQGIHIDTRNFKKKTAYCPNKQCNFSKGHAITMQAEVDVAIVMKAMKSAILDQIDTLVLVAGDGDFRDLIEFFTTTLHKKVVVFGWR